MLQVYKIKDNRDETLLDNEVMVELPNFEALIFNIDSDYFINEITGNTPIEEDFLNFICCCEEYDNIIKSAIKRCLINLVNCSLYVADKSIDDLVNKFNSIEIEEITWLIIKDDVLNEFRTLYENNKKETLL